MATDFAGTTQAVAYGESVEARRRRGDPGPGRPCAGLGPVAVVLEGHCASSSPATTSAARDPTCAPFEPVPCDVFITEATFGLPVFRHPRDAAERSPKLLTSVALFPERAHLVGAYALGKAQRVIRLLREAGYDEPIYVHGALER